MRRHDCGALLARHVFEASVFARTAGRCVFCAASAQDAHHILERKLFLDGGYRLANGAAVCAEHHWKCETTQLSVEAVRQAAGITTLVLPEGFDASARYDKWGNRIWPSGLRSWGPLQHDDGPRRALAAAGLLGWLMPPVYAEDDLPERTES